VAGSINVTTPGETQAQAHSRRGFVVGILLCVVATAFEAMAVLTAMPAAAKDLGGHDYYAWTFTGFVIAQTFAIVAAGLACDRFGPVRPLMIGFGLFTVGVVLAAMSPTMPLLIGARVVQGLGGGTMNLAIMVLVGLVFDGHERAVMMTGFSFAWMAPSFVGPPVAAWLSENLSWHWVFWSVLPLLAVSGALSARPLLRLPLPDLAPADVQTRRFLASAGMVSIGAALVQWAGQHIELLSLLWLAMGLVLLWFGLRPLMPAGYALAGRGLAAVINVRSALAGAFFGAQAFLPLMLTEARGLELQWAAWTMTIGSLGWTFGSWLQSRRWLRMRRDAIITAGALSLGVGLALLAIGAWLQAVPVAILLIGWIFAGLGMGLAVASTSLGVMQLSHAVELGRSTSSLQVGEALGNSLGAGLAGTLYLLAAGVLPTALGFAPMLTAMAGVAVLGTLASRRIGELANHSAAA